MPEKQILQDVYYERQERKNADKERKRLLYEFHENERQNACKEKEITTLASRIDKVASLWLFYFPRLYD